VLAVINFELSVLYKFIFESSVCFTAPWHYFTKSFSVHLNRYRKINREAEIRCSRIVKRWHWHGGDEGRNTESWVSNRRIIANEQSVSR